jgi:hypothetical protein
MKKLPIGISDFRKVIRDNNYFVDKSMLIHELINFLVPPVLRWNA